MKRLFFVWVFFCGLALNLLIPFQCHADSNDDLQVIWEWVLDPYFSPSEPSLELWKRLSHAENVMWPYVDTLEEGLVDHAGVPLHSSMNAYLWQWRDKFLAKAHEPDWLDQSIPDRVVYALSATITDYFTLFRNGVPAVDYGELSKRVAGDAHWGHDLKRPPFYALPDWLDQFYSGATSVKPPARSIRVAATRFTLRWGNGYLDSPSYTEYEPIIRGFMGGTEIYLHAPMYATAIGVEYATPGDGVAVMVFQHDRHRGGSQ